MKLFVNFFCLSDLKAELHQRTLNMFWLNSKLLIFHFVIRLWALQVFHCNGSVLFFDRGWGRGGGSREIFELVPRFSVSESPRLCLFSSVCLCSSLMSESCCFQHLAFRRVNKLPSQPRPHSDLALRWKTRLDEQS